MIVFKKYEWLPLGNVMNISKRLTSLYIGKIYILQSIIFFGIIQLRWITIS